MAVEIRTAASDDEINACYPVMAELRPHLSSEEFLAQVKRQSAAADFRLIYLADEGVKAVAGVRIAEWLPSGKTLEIEDLVAKDGERSKGYGGKLFDSIIELAERESCKRIKLVSHVTRFAAHKFYLNKGMIIEAHYFSMPVK